MERFLKHFCTNFITDKQDYFIKEKKILTVCTSCIHVYIQDFSYPEPHLDTTVFNLGTEMIWGVRGGGRGGGVVDVGV